ncbi:MAG: DUF5668 domain-containing protein [Terriglobales bacterium]
MNCAQHPEVAAAAYCRTCGKPLCEVCKRDVRGVIYCEDCLATRVQSPPEVAMQVPASGPHPAVAGVLAGFLPFGVAQVYNGQYARGLVYLGTFVTLVWAADKEGLFGIAIAAFYCWQMIDAIRSAWQIRLGLPAPDPFGIDRLFGGGGAPVVPSSASPAPGSTVNLVSTGNYGAPPPPGVIPAGCCGSDSRLPIGAIILIALGVLFLLGNVGILHWNWAGENWPIILIAAGIWVLVRRWPVISSGTLQGRRQLMGPAVLLTLGSTFLADSIGGYSFHRTFPVLFIVIGLVLLWQRSTPSLPMPPPPPPMSNGEQPQPQNALERQER